MSRYRDSKCLENQAIMLAVQVGRGSRARNTLALALKRIRKEVSRDRAKWLRNHIIWITGKLFKD